MRRRLKPRVKIALLLILAVITFSMFLLELNSSKDVTKSNTLTYTKKSNLNYVTYLKNNSHYDARYLKDDFNFVANLIDYFSLDYNYTYTSTEDIKYDLTYGITAELVVYDSDNSAKPIEKRPFVLMEDTKLTGTGQIIKVDIFNQKVIYDTYNLIVQEWKKEISPNANLKISINVNWTGHADKINKDISDNCQTIFNIPIAQKTIDIKNPRSISEDGRIVTEASLPWWYIAAIITTIILFIVNVICLFMAIVNCKKTSKYEQKINKILREFDRAITEAKGKFTKSEDENYIEVKSFMELLDVHDNINEPIIYYRNNDDLSVFAVKNTHDTYYTIIKRSDFDD